MFVMLRNQRKSKRKINLFSSLSFIAWRKICRFSNRRSGSLRENLFIFNGVASIPLSVATANSLSPHDSLRLDISNCSIPRRKSWSEIKKNKCSYNAIGKKVEHWGNKTWKWRMKVNRGAVHHTPLTSAINVRGNSTLPARNATIRSVAKVFWIKLWKMKK